MAFWTSEIELSKYIQQNIIFHVFLQQHKVLDEQRALYCDGK